MRAALVLALAKAGDAVEYHVDVRDEVMDAVSGAVVVELLRHPQAADLCDDLGWRRALRRWSAVRTRVGPPPLELLDEVLRLATVRLHDAEYAAQVQAGCSA